MAEIIIIYRGFATQSHPTPQSSHYSPASLATACSFCLSKIKWTYSGQKEVKANKSIFSASEFPVFEMFHFGDDGSGDLLALDPWL